MPQEATKAARGRDTAPHTRTSTPRARSLPTFSRSESPANASSRWTTGIPSSISATTTERAVSSTGDILPSHTVNATFTIFFLMSCSLRDREQDTCQVRSRSNIWHKSLRNSMIHTSRRRGLCHDNLIELHAHDYITHISRNCATLYRRAGGIGPQRQHAIKMPRSCPGVPTARRMNP